MCRVHESLATLTLVANTLEINMCVVCTKNHGIPTYLALYGTLYLSMLCQQCVQIACAASGRNPKLGAWIVTKLDTVYDDN